MSVELERAMDSSLSEVLEATAAFDEVLVITKRKEIESIHMPLPKILS